ncbi:MAG: prepilin-type N-terminal cleavage/methylation domain-containing protein [Thermoguttaceae bacterium]|nr:prepilin-type N-terminal cleavage/methylation domain-containing protein [Thermoguttaceae bacterium]
MKHGFTLLELLLVLALMIVIASLGTSSLDRTLERAEFKAGVIKLQAEFHQTRLLAMKSGIPYAFRYIPGTNIYEIIPRDLLIQDQQQKINETGIVGSLTRTPVADGMSASNRMTVPLNESTGGLTGGNLMNDAIAELDGTNMFPDGNDSFSRFNQPGTETGPGNEWSNPRELTENAGYGNRGNNARSFNDSGIMAEIPGMNGGSGMPGNMSGNDPGTAGSSSFQHFLEGGVAFGYSYISRSTKTDLSATGGVPDAEGESTMVGGLDKSIMEEEEQKRQQSQWSTPILFYPNGRTSNAVFQLFSTGRHTFYSEIALRGMTGVARINYITADPPARSTLIPQSATGTLPYQQNMTPPSATGTLSYQQNMIP